MRTAGIDEGLLEREVELSVLRRCIEDALSGRGRFVVVEGPPGIGKSQLVRAAGELASNSGLSVLFARGSELELDVPFGVVRQLFDPAFALAGEAGRRRLLSGAAEQAADVLSYGAQYGSFGDDPGLGMLHGLFWVTSNLAEIQPLMLAVDDLHWCDHRSLRYLAFLVNRVHDLPVCLLVASRAYLERKPRPDEGEELVRKLRLEPSATHLRPGPLDREGVAQLAEAQLGHRPEESTTRACHDATGGNPLLATELLRQMAGSHNRPLSGLEIGDFRAERISAAMRSRLQSVSPQASRLSAAMAILGDPVESRLLEEFAELDQATIAEASQELVVAGILAEDPPLRFLHPVIRTALYDTIPAVERSQGHRRAVQLLASRAAEPERSAAHLLRVYPAGDEAVVDTLVHAARSAAGRGAPDAAADYLRRALDEPPAEGRVAGLVLALGSSGARAGSNDAEDHLREAFARAEVAEDRVVAAVELGQVLAYTGRVGEAAALVGEVLEDVIEERRLARPLQMMLLVMAETDVEAREIAAPVVSQALETVERRGASAPLGLLALAAIHAATGQGTAERAAELALWALEDGTLLEEQTPEAPHPYFATAGLALAGRELQAEQFLDIAVAEAQQRGSARGFASASAMRGWCRARRGDMAGAAADAQAALELVSALGWQLFQLLALSVRIDVLVGADELSEAEACLAEYGAGARTLGGSVLTQPLHVSVARLELARGEADKAMASLERCARWERAWDGRTGTWPAWRPLAAGAAAKLGDPERGAALAIEAAEMARRFGSRRDLAAARHAQALLTTDSEPRLGLLQEAAREVDKADAALLEAEILHELGRTLRVANHARDAREPLDRAAALARRAGAPALAERALAELASSGARPRIRGESAADELTPSERRVARMAAEGMSNREIAESLFVTLKTVETHLSRVYRKLEISSRAQLAGKLGGDGDSRT